jgi:hypothetical protein
MDFGGHEGQISAVVSLCQILSFVLISALSAAPTHG